MRYAQSSTWICGFQQPASQHDQRSTYAADAPSEANALKRPSVIGISIMAFVAELQPALEKLCDETADRAPRERDQPGAAIEPAASAAAGTVRAWLFHLRIYSEPSER